MVVVETASASSSRDHIRAAVALTRTRTQATWPRCVTNKEERGGGGVEVEQRQSSAVWNPCDGEVSGEIYDVDGAVWQRRR